jgi:hypothetical protein
MENFYLPPLPPDFVPNFLIQPDAISNDELLTFNDANIPSFDSNDPSRPDRFPKDEDGSTSLFDDLETTVDNLSHQPGSTELSRDQWIEAAAFISQALVKGLTKKAKHLGGTSFYNDLPLESQTNLTFFANDIDKLQRFFKIPFHEKNSVEYCTNCLKAQGTVPTREHWIAQLELCGHDASAAKHSLINQFMLKFNTSMHEWYDENRKMAHEAIVDRIIHTSNPPVVVADPRILEWCHLYAEQARENLVNYHDTKAKEEAQNNYAHQLTVYELTHANDLAIKKNELEAQFHLEVANIRQDVDVRIAKIREEAAEQIRLAKTGNIQQIEEAKADLRLETEAHTPTIQDPVARKKRRGSISIAPSPTILKRQDYTLVPDAPLPVDPTPLPSAPPQHDPIMTSMKSMMESVMGSFGKQLETITDRLDRIESSKNDTYTTTWEQDRDPVHPWGLTKEQENLEAAIDPYDAGKYDNIDYNSHEMLDVPDSPDEMGIDVPDEELTTTALADPGLLKPTGLRPPERANRVDFINPHLATDSFGLSLTGGRCLPDGSMTYAPQPKPKRPPPLPKGTTALDEDALEKLSRDTIRAHAKLIFDTNIPRQLLKAEMINRYLNLARNANKPGAPQQTRLSFAAATSSKANNNNDGFTTVPRRQTTPSAWSNSPPPPQKPRSSNKPPSNTTTWIIRPRMGTQGLTERPFSGSDDKLTNWYRQRLEANAGGNKPALTLLSGRWAIGPKSIFTLIFSGNIPHNILRAYTSLFLEQFDREHIFHPAEDMKKIALFNIPMNRNILGDVPTRLELHQEIMRGGSLAGLDWFDGPVWTPNSRNNTDAITGTAHLLVRAPTDRSLTNFFRRNTYMFNAKIAAQLAIPPRPFVQCTRCYRLNHSVDKCRLPNTISICSSCGSTNHKTAQHKHACKETHDGPSCSCPPRCFLCRNARKSPAQFTGHTAIDPSCPLRRYTFVPSGPTETNPTLTHV